MRCALCLQSAELLNSHIIPEFLYTSLYDEKHRFHVLTADPSQRNSIAQKGIREPLLCSACEQKLSIWERYASLVLKGGIELTYHRQGNLVKVDGLDYTQFRLFQLSVLWRAGISSLHFFEKVRLGHHAETIRRMLHQEDPGTHTRFGCIIFGITFQGEAFTQLIMQPSRFKLEGHTAYRFVFGGFKWVFLVSNHDTLPPLERAILQPQGSTLLQIRSAHEMENLVRFSKELARMGRNP